MRQATPSNVGRFVPFSEGSPSDQHDAARFRALLDLVRQPVMVIGRDHKLRFANAAARRGASVADPVADGWCCHELSHHRDTPCDEPCPLAEAISSRNTTSVRHVHLQADGSRRTIELTATPVFDEQGEVLEIVEVGEDITERVALERKEELLREQFAQAQKMETVGTLAGGVAHDFNNLLTVIMSFTEMTRDSLPRGEEGHEDLQSVLEASRRAKNLIRQLLVFSRKDTSEPEEVDLRDLVSRAQKMLKRLIAETIEITMELPDEEVLVWGDPALLQQVLINLAVNSRDAMPDGGRIEIRLRRCKVTSTEECRAGSLKPGPHARLTVCDTGHGMDAATAARVFEPFFTTKAAGQGTGLGMAMVHGTVLNAGGGLRLNSRPGAGTSISVLLPIHHGGDEVVVEEDPAPAPPAGLALVVEDERAIRKLVGRALEREGWEVIVADDGVTALAAIAGLARPIDVLVADAVMPHLGGFELAARLRNEQPELPVVIMSGYIGSDTDSALIAGRGHASLGKPFAIAELFGAIASVLPDEMLRSGRAGVRITGRGAKQRPD